MFKRLLISATVAFVSITAWAAFAAAETDRIAELTEKDKALYVKSIELETSGSELFARIRVLKEKDSRQRGILEDLELTGLLKEAVELSRRHDALEKEQAAVRAELVAALKDGIRQLASKKRLDGAESERAAAWARMLKTLEEAPAGKPGRVLEIKAAATDGPRDLMDKADFLSDSEDKLRREMGEVRVRIAEAREDLALKSESGHFVKEHAAFDDEYSKQVWSRTIDRPVAAGNNVGPEVAVGSETDKGGNPGYGIPDTPSVPTQQIVISGSMSQILKGDPQSVAGQESVEDEIGRLEANLSELENRAKDLSYRSKTLREEAERLKKELQK